MFCMLQVKLEKALEASEQQQMKAKSDLQQQESELRRRQRELHDKKVNLMQEGR